jgi:hypothetical protein
MGNRTATNKAFTCAKQMRNGGYKAAVDLKP